MIEVCTQNMKFAIWIMIGIATSVAAVLTVVLESNLRYLVSRIIPQLRRLGGRIPTRRPPIIWLLYLLSILIVIIGTAIVSTCEPQLPTPPASEKLYYMTIIDASDRMLTSIGGEQKWQAAVRSLQEKLAILPGGAHYGLISFGQASSLTLIPCNEAAEVLVPLSDTSVQAGSETISSQQRSIHAVAGITPGNKGSLTQALHLAMEQLVSGLPESYSKTLIIVTGGGDLCNPQSEWDSLEFLLSGTVKDVSVYTELIVFVNEEVKEEIASKIQKISRLETVTVSLPATPEELKLDLDAAVNRAVERGMTVDPRPFIVQETIVAATQNSHSVNANVPINFPAITPSQIIPTFTRLLSSSTPVVLITDTMPPSPTESPTNPPPTQIPATPIPPTKIPTTSVPIIQWNFTSPDGTYGVKKIYYSANDAHYQIFRTSNNELIMTTYAKYPYPSENDVKTGMFGNSNMFAAAYHYGDNGNYTWIGVWELPSGNFLYCEQIDGWTLDISGVFGGPSGTCP